MAQDTAAKHTAKDRQPPPRTPQNARLAADSPRELVGPAGRRRRRAKAASEAPIHTNAYRGELSPRNLPVGVAIAIGPSPRKTRLELQSPGLGGATAATRAQRCLTRSWQQLFLAKNQLRTKSEPLEPS